MIWRLPGRSGTLHGVAEISVARARTVLARAFFDDPLMVWFFPDPAVRPHACAALLGLLAERYLADGRVDVAPASEPMGVALWRWPGPAAEPQDGPEELPSVGGLMAGFMGADRAREVGAAMASLDALRPPQPYAYLHLLAVDPDACRRGLGGELLDRGLAAARDAGLVACLETMNPANVPFYEAHGMSVRHEVDLAAGGPTAWSLATG